MITKELFTNRTTNGFSDYEQLASGLATLKVEGTFDGAILKCQARNSEETEWAYTGSADDLKEERGYAAFEYLQKTQIRYELTNAGGSTDITLIFVN